MTFTAVAPVERVLELAASGSPGATAAAAVALREALAGIRTSSWPEVAWQFSRITGDGYPVEFTFSSHDGALRYTTEVGGPEMGHAARIAAACQWAGVGDLSLPVGTVPPSGGPLRWGAWGGGRHLGELNRRKAYVETSTIEPALARWLPAGAVPRFVGVTAAAADREYYFRRDRLETAELGRLLCGAGLRDCVEPLVDAVAATLPRPVRDRLLPAEAGFSLVEGAAASLFTYARSVWGGDGEIRRNVIDLAGRHGWDLQLYDAVTRPLADATGYRTHHGVLAWIAAPGQPVTVRVSVRPPDPP